MPAPPSPMAQLRAPEEAEQALLASPAWMQVEPAIKEWTLNLALGVYSDYVEAQAELRELVVGACCLTQAALATDGARGG